jgi:indole-3-glycerol phosphate synthase
MEALVEVHSREELTRALAAGARIVGVNNRDLRDFQVHVETSLELAEAIPDDRIAVSESGLRSHSDLVRLQLAGFDAFLIGEQVMQSADPGAALRELREPTGTGHPAA